MGGLDQAFTGQAERSGARATSVLVARITGNANPCDTRGEEARIRCLRSLMQAAEISGGRVLRQQRDAVLVLLSNADAAVAAATRMQASTATSSAEAGYSVRIGLASGPVTQRNDEVLGDPVNLALQFSREARNGQILASGVTTANLSPALQTTLGVSAGADEHAVVREIRWRDKGIELLAMQKEARAARPHTVLQLQHGEKTILRRREFDYVTLGRDDRSHIVVSSQLASRRHCTISRNEDGFVLQDHSRNGTFVMVEGDGESFLHSDAGQLGKEGWICLGISGDESDQVIRYKILLVA